jgi:hypothetical protein
MSRAVVFDFDETLAVSTGAPRSNPTRLFGGPERLNELRRLLRDLSAAGVRLSVCSYNSRTIFEPLLKAASLHRWFDESLLLGYEAFEERGALHKATGSMQGEDCWDKGSVMKHAIVPAVTSQPVAPAPDAEETLGFTASSGTVDPSADGQSTILFCDDDPANIRDVRGVCASCATLFVPRQQHDSGLQAPHMAAIREWARIGPGAPLASADAAVEEAPGPEACRSPQPPPLRGKRAR